MLLWGDSHMMHWIDGLDFAAKRLGVKLIVATKGNCMPANYSADNLHDSAVNIYIEGAMRSCMNRNMNIRDLYASDVNYIVLGSIYFAVDFSSSLKGSVLGLATNISELSQQGKIFIMEEAPRLRDQGNGDANTVIACYLDIDENCAFSEERRRLFDDNFENIKQANRNIELIPTGDLFDIDDHGEHKVIGGVPVFYDLSHISGSYSLTTGPYFYKWMSDILAR
jgi:hypothetical protein